MTKGFVAVLISCCALGCATGFDRKPSLARMQDNSVSITDADVAFAQAVKPQLKFPCRIALYLSSHNAHPWRWTAKDKSQLEACGQALIKDQIASDVFLISPMFVEEDSKGLNLKAIRVAAAKHGADAVFIVQGNSDAEMTKTPAALLDLTIIGGYLIPGWQCDALFLMQGGLLDVNNGFLYASIEAEGSARKFGPNFVLETADTVEKAKTEAIKNFIPEVLTRMRNVRDTANQPVSPMTTIGPIQEIDPKTGKPITR